MGEHARPLNTRIRMVRDEQTGGTQHMAHRHNHGGEAHGGGAWGVGVLGTVEGSTVDVGAPGAPTGAGRGGRVGDAGGAGKFESTRGII